MVSLDSLVQNFVDERYFGTVNRFSLVDMRDNKLERNYTDNLFDRRTGDIYELENPGILVGKFAAALLAVPVYAIGKALFHTAALPYVVAETLVKGVESLLVETEFAFSDQMGKLGHHSVEVIRCGYYYAGISLALIRGIYKTETTSYLYAHETRTMVAHLEKEWSHYVPRNRDFRYVSVHNDLSQADYYYLAFCFLPNGNIEDKIGETEYLRYTLSQQRILGERLREQQAG